LHHAVESDDAPWALTEQKVAAVPDGDLAAVRSQRHALQPHLVSQLPDFIHTCACCQGLVSSVEFISHAHESCS